MQLLLVHQNFPAQFRSLAPAWLTAGHAVSAIGSRDSPGWPGLHYGRYRFDADAPTPLERGQAVARLGRRLHAGGLRPDVVIAHSGWGESLQLRQVFPEAALVVYPELWLTPAALGIGFDPQLQLSSGQLGQQLEALQRLNLLAELAISQADAVVVPHAGQALTFPEALRSRITVIADGVDTTSLQPDRQARFRLPCGTTLQPGDPLITVVGRELEPLRGLRQVLQAWPAVAAARPQARLLLVGGSEGGYGIESPRGSSHLEDALAALPAGTDQSRIHALGRLPHPELRALLQCSAAHLGLSYPYTVSWSTLEAMACGAPLLINPEHPLAADLQQGENAWCVPFHDSAALANAISALLAQPQRQRQLGRAGRALIEARFSLSGALDHYRALFTRLAPAAAPPPAGTARARASHHDGVGARAAARDTRPY